MSLKPKSIEAERFHRRKRKPKRMPLDSYFEYGLSDGKGNYWTGNLLSARKSWSKETEPTFNEYGGRWMSEKRVLDLWADYNLHREIYGTDWPDLILEKFEISVNKAPPSDLKPPNWSKLVLWHEIPRYEVIYEMADALIKNGIEFKYIMKYIGDGTELPSHIVKSLQVHERVSWGSQPTRAVVAFDSDKDMVFAIVMLGSLVKEIVTDEAVTVYKAEEA